MVGGGAAGIFAALRVRELAPQHRVLVLESATHPLQKVKISGGGRCNVTHACFDLSRLLSFYPRGHKELRPILSRFGPAQTMEWFEQRGVPLKTESDGRVFPVSDRSQSIIDCLLGEAERLGVEVRTRATVVGLERQAQGFALTLRQESLLCRRLLLATGGNAQAWSWAAELGHHPVAGVPSLFTFTLKDPRFTELAGLSVEVARGKLAGIRQEGPVLFTHWGLSGPLILRLSAWGARELAERDYHMPLALDLLPELAQEEVLVRLLEVQQRTPQRQLGTDCPFALPRRLWRALLGEMGGQPWHRCPRKALNRLVEDLKNLQLEVVGKGVFKEEFVTAGGVPLGEVDLRTMESKLCPGLFFAGEILNVDGLTGGFNFQNAWATGWTAAQGIAQES